MLRRSSRAIRRACSASPRPRSRAPATRGDRELVAALAKETSDIAKLEIAYALARGGDKRGTDALVGGAAAAARDVRLERRAGSRCSATSARTRRARRVPRRPQLRLGAARAARVLWPIRAAIKVLDDRPHGSEGEPDEQGARDDRARHRRPARRRAGAARAARRHGNARVRRGRARRPPRSRPRARCSWSSSTSRRCASARRARCAGSSPISTRGPLVAAAPRRARQPRRTPSRSRRPRPCSSLPVRPPGPSTSSR